MTCHGSAKVALLTALLAGSLAFAQGPPPSIVADGVPPIPAELKARMNQYLNTRSAMLADWHPSERSVLILTRFGDTAQVHLVQTPGGYRQQLTFFPDRVFAARFSPRADRHSFVFAMDSGGSEFYQLYRFDFADGSTRLLTDGKSRNEDFIFNHRGDRVAYVSTRRNGRDFDLYLIDPEQPPSDKLALELKGAWAPLAWSSDDRHLLLEQRISVNESYLHFLEIASGRLQPLLSNRGGKASYGPAVWSRDGKGVYYVSDAGSEFKKLFYLDLTDKSVVPLSDSISWDIEAIALSPDGGVLAFSANVEGASRLHLLDTAARRELPAPTLPQGQITNLRFHRRRKELAFTLNSVKSAGDVYSYNPETRKLEQWTFSETGGLNPREFREPELVHYSTFDQVNGRPREIAAFVTRPSEKFRPPYPVLINIHGGPEGQTRPGFQGRYNYFINDMGIALVEPNVRGSTGYGKTFTDLDNGYRREDSVKDIGALLDWVATQPDLDAKRVTVMGGSYGGYMSLATMTHYSDRLRCGIDIVGVSNFVALLEHTESYRRDLRRVEYGDERDSEMRKFLISISPTSNAAKIRVPVLVAAGKNDPRVPAVLSEEIMKKVRSNRNIVWYIVAQDEGHGFVKKPNVDYLLNAEALFLQDFLLK